MEGGGFSPNSAFGAFSDNNMDLDLMDELLFEGCWLETAAGNRFNLMQSGPLTSGPPTDLPQYYSSDASNSHLSLTLPQQMYQEETPKCFVQNPPPVSPKIEELVDTQSQESKAVQTAGSPGQSESFLLEGTEISRRLWIGPSAYPGPSTSVRERLKLAVGHLKNLLKDKDVLIQIWIPINREGKQVLTTRNQPFSLDNNCKSLVNYRVVSRDYIFRAEKDSKELSGLPGRVFLEKLPEWTPDVRFFRKDEYPRIEYAQQFNVRGSIALPVFERGSRTCLGVVEFVTTTQKTHYRPELDTVCKALEAVDLHSSHNSCAPRVEASYESYQAALPRIVEVLASLCKTHNLPLAQTWASCIQLGKDGCRHSNENYRVCVSTVDSACVMANSEMLQFHEACSEHHLFQGEGLVGRAFLTNKPIFASDVTAFRKTVYPLSHHARMFGLGAAAAIPLRSIHSRSTDFVLEFFLPKECKTIEEQKAILSSLSIVIQQSCQMLNLVLGVEFGREIMPPVWEMIITSDETFNDQESQKLAYSSKGISSEKSSWIAHMIEAQKKGKGVSISLESQKEPKEEFSLTAHWGDCQVDLNHGQVFPECGQFHEGNQAASSIDGHQLLGSRRSCDKRRTKTEKNISLEVLRQYFSGSLKDAAKSIGVCPTTLKRICRQHGISRWPSRKIKKVGHSLRKLQLVIDSVQGAEGGIQIGNFYKSFPELSSPNLSGSGPYSSSKLSDESQQTNSQPDNGLGSQAVTASKSPTSSGSQSTGSTTGSTEEKQQFTTATAANGASEEHGGSLKRALSDAELHVSNQEETKFLARSQSHRVISHPSGPENGTSILQHNGRHLKIGSGFKVKATFGDAKVRFTLQPSWGFRELQQEIASRFNINDTSAILLKYLDDEKEWVLLTCDADLEECVDIYRSSQSRTIKLSLYQAGPDIRVYVPS